MIGFQEGEKVNSCILFALSPAPKCLIFVGPCAKNLINNNSR